MIDPVYVYIFGPPVAALGFLGAMWVSSSRRTKALDVEIAAYRAQEAAKASRADTIIEQPLAIEERAGPQPRLIEDEIIIPAMRGEILTSAGGHGGVVIVGLPTGRLKDFRKAKSAGIRVKAQGARLSDLIIQR